MIFAKNYISYLQALDSKYSCFSDFFEGNESAILKRPFRHIDGNCWAVDLDSLLSLGDNINSPCSSPLVLFEDGNLLTKSHTIHEEIVREGCGRYSHWGPTLYFSSSDNSNPNTNRRTYCIRQRRVVADLIDDQMLQQIAVDDDLMYQLIAYCININAHPLNQAIFSFGRLKEMFARTGEDYIEKIVLEIGSSPRLGLGLLFALTGVKKYIANNVLSISDQTTGSFLKLLQLIAYVVQMDGYLRNIPDLTSAIDPTSSNSLLKINPDIVQIIDNTAAEMLNIESNSVDIILSQSVLEHVSDPINVLKKSFDLLKPGGYAYHSVDLTEHSSPLEPLRFLKLGQEEYIVSTGAPENRFRYSDFIKMFECVGFQIHSTRLYTQLNKHLPNGQVNIAEYIESGSRNDMSYCSLEAIIPWVDDVYKSKFSQPFRDMDNRNLSILYFDIICRKPM